MAHNISGFQGLIFEIFVLDMANNHQGQLQHGLKIIDELKDVVPKHGEGRSSNSSSVISPPSSIRDTARRRRTNTVPRLRRPVSTGICTVHTR